jgi:ABC-2 type transport system ATP-binding protein
VFFSSHIMSEVQAVADRVAMIREGEIVEVAETQSLIHRALRHVRVQFKEPVKPEMLAALPGVTLLSRNNGLSITLQVSGDMDALIKALGRFPVCDLETTRPSLEEVFLAYYTRRE